MRGAIFVSNLGKRYRKRDRGRPSSLKGRILSGYRASKPKPFWGIRHATFSVAPGRAVGIVGANGAGKSTLLRLLGGVGRPDEGTVEVHGRIGALLDIGAGLTEDLTGRENVYLLGVIAGLLREEVENQLHAIVDFAELAAFIDEPVRNYSTGMRMRLAFSVAVHTLPDILLIDEILAVGDQSFQRKCIERIRSMQAKGCTIILVSHDESQVRAVCQDVIFIRHGSIVAQGPIDATIDEYNRSMGNGEPDEAECGVVREQGSSAARITGIELSNGNGQPAATLAGGEPLSISVRVEQNGLALSPIVGIILSDTNGVVCLQTNSILGGLDLGVFESCMVCLDIARLDLAPGRYTISIALFAGNWKTIFEYQENCRTLRVVGAQTEGGVLGPPLRWKVLEMDAAEPDKGQRAEA